MILAKYKRQHGISCECDHCFALVRGWEETAALLDDEPTTVDLSGVGGSGRTVGPTSEPDAAPYKPVAPVMLPGGGLA